LAGDDHLGRPVSLRIINVSPGPAYSDEVPVELDAWVMEADGFMISRPSRMAIVAGSGGDRVFRFVRYGFRKRDGEFLILWNGTAVAINMEVPGEGFSPRSLFCRALLSRPVECTACSILGLSLTDDAADDLSLRIRRRFRI